MSALVDLARRLSERLAAGATLLVHARDELVPDAHHVVVEFVHPVIVGKRAYPALFAATARDVELLGRPGDVALVLGAAPGVADAARRAGCELMALDARDGGYVTAYHLLWEITQLFAEAVERPSDADLAFLYGGSTVAGAGADAEREAARKREASGRLCAAVLDGCADELDRCAAAIGERVRAGGRVFTFGNGGSSTDAASLAVALRARGVGAVALADETAVVTALANDVGVEHVFARQVAALATPRDVAVGLSTSGGSANVLAAFAQARRGGLLTVGFAGYDGGAMAGADSIDHLFVVGSDSVHRIQEAQGALYGELARRVSGAHPEPPDGTLAR